MDLLSELFSAGVWGTEPPEMPNWIKWIHRNMSENHCDICLRLDECWFSYDNKPTYPHHQYCHCILEPLSYDEVLNKATSISDYSKFDPYLFDPENLYQHGKQKMFENWGYTIEDSQWLKEEFEKQALEKYVSGEYKLGLLNKYGQRISIRIEIPRKDKKDTVSFISGWMVWPNGKINLSTPYGGE